MGLRARLGWFYLAAIGLLLLNDHELKGAGVLPAVVTGKASDFLGLCVAPLALVLFVSWLRPALARDAGARRRLIAVCFAVVVVPFVLANVSSDASIVLVRLLGMIGVSWRLWPDPTDLVALSVLPASYWLCSRWLRSAVTQGSARGTQVSLAMLGAVACLASGVPPASDSDLGFLVNQSGHAVTVRTSRLAGIPDCSSHYLPLEDGVVRPEDFGPAGTTEVPDGAVRRLTPDRWVWQHTVDRCSPIRISVSGPENLGTFTGVILFLEDAGRWITEDPSKEELRDDQGLARIVRRDGALTVELGGGMRFLELDASTGPAEPATEECAIRPRAGISGPDGTGEITAITPIGDRCHELTLDGVGVDGGAGGEGGASTGAPEPTGSAGAPFGGAGGMGATASADAAGEDPWVAPMLRGRRVHVCLDYDLPFEVGDRVTVSTTDTGGSISSDRKRVAFDVVTEGLEHTLFPGACPQLRDACGAIWEFQDRSVSSSAGPIRREALDSAAQGLILHNAYRVLVARSDCPSPLTTPKRRLEWIDIAR